MAETNVTSSLGWDNFYSTTTTASITATTTTIPLATPPTPTEGFLVLDPGGANEIIFYNQVSGNNVIVPSTDDRGRGDTTAAAHSSGITVKMNTVGMMFEALQSGRAISAGAIGNTQLAAGVPVQVVSTAYASAGQGTTTIPYDDTIPQNTEGTEFMTQSITPKSATNILVIEVVLLGANSGASNNLIVALFQDSAADALAVDSNPNNTANQPSSVTLMHKMVAGTTSSTTFKVRAGGNGAGTLTFNGFSSGRMFGATTKSFIKITEYKV